MGRFHVQTRLVEILGGLYHSSEEALKELVANSWDADATEVSISLPMALTGQPVVIQDNGSGMTPQELDAHYLGVAIDRRRISGPTTPRNLKVRGHLGIGKFAGFVLADRLIVTTVARGLRSRLVLDKSQLQDRDEDLEDVDVPISTDQCEDAAGTTIELTLLRPGREQPSPKKLGAILLREFGLKDDFRISIDGVPLTPDVLEGRKMQIELPLPSGSVAEVTGWLLPKERGVADTGFLLRVDDRAVGPTTYYGLDEDSDVPRGVLRRLYVEVKADHLREDVTANWSGVVENSTLYQELQQEVGPTVKKHMLGLLEGEESDTEGQFIQRYEQQLELLPFARRDQARQQLLRIFKRLFGETIERKHVVAEFVLNVFEQDRYWLIARRIDEIEADDLLKLAEVLRDWGLGDIADVAVRAKARLRFLDHFERLTATSGTLELKGVHPVLEANPWLIGDEFELWASNKQMQSTVRKYADRVYQESNGKKRPDLLMIGLDERRLLIELKRPSWEVTWQDVGQAKEYRDSLQPYFPNKKFLVRVIGGTAAVNMAREDGPGVRITTYAEIVDEARSRLRWLVDNLDQDGGEELSPRQEQLEL